MNWPTIGKYRLTGPRALFAALVLLDATLALTGKDWTGLAFILALWASVVLLREARTRLIWKVRNRLIVTYLFIFLVPMALMLAFFLVAGWGITSQVAGYMLSSAMKYREETIRTPARLLARELAADRIAIVQQLTATGLPSFEALVTGSQTFRYPADAKIEMPPERLERLHGRGLQRRRALFHVARYQQQEQGSDPRAHHKGGPWRSRSRSRQRGTAGPRVAVGSGKGRTFAGALASHTDAVAGRIPPQSNVLDFEISGVAPIEVADWSHPNSQASTVMVIITRLSAVLGVVFPSAVIESMTFGVVIFYVITALLGAALLFSLLHRWLDDADHHRRRS